MSLFEGGKKDGGGANGDFYSVNDVSDHRIDLRWPDGSRVSLPYIHLHEVKFTPGGDTESDTILLHYTAHTVVQVVGKRLAALYDALHGHRVTWMRNKSEGEELPQGKLCIEDLRYSEISDWETDLKARKEHRRVLAND